MKALLYLIGLIAVGLAIAWFGFGMHPRTVWYKITSSISATSSEQSSNLSSTASRMKEVASDRFGEAQDKYNGNIEVDDPYAYPTARP